MGSNCCRLPATALREAVYICYAPAFLPLKWDKTSPYFKMLLQGLSTLITYSIYPTMHCYFRSNKKEKCCQVICDTVLSLNQCQKCWNLKYAPRNWLTTARWSIRNDSRHSMRAVGELLLGLLTAFSPAHYEEWDNPHFPDEETETGRDEVIWPSSQSRWVLSRHLNLPLRCNNL